MNKLYERLKAEKGITDYKVAQDTGVPRSTLSEWGQGKYIPKADKLLKLAEYFNVTIEDFLKNEVTE